jgi:hypothetical protein
MSAPYVNCDCSSHAAPKTEGSVLFLAVISILPPAADFGRVVEGGSRGQVLSAVEGVPPSRPVNLPENALRVTSANKMVRDCLAQGQSHDDLHGTWFIVSEIHLSSGRATDLVGMLRPSEGPSAGRCPLQAHSMPFWILLKQGGGCNIVLESNVQVLRVLSTMPHDHLDIETTVTNLNETTKWLSRFGGEKYALKKKTSIPQQ